MIDINKTLDLIKLRLYNEYLYTAHLYDEGESNFHRTLTTQVVENYIDPLNLPKDSVILDMGCGPGYFLNEMKARGFTNLTGITLSDDDVKICAANGHTTKMYDFSFLPQQDGFWDEGTDFIFLRQVLEHSPYPIFTLMEYNRILKQFGTIYIEVPAPNCERQLESNLNHYSILGDKQLSALLVRTGFSIEKFDTIEFELTGKTAEGDDKTFKESYYCIVAKKQRPIDIK